MDIGVADEDKPVTVGSRLTGRWFGGSGQPIPNLSQGGELFTARREPVPLLGGARGGLLDSLAEQLNQR